MTIDPQYYVLRRVPACHGVDQPSRKLPSFRQAKETMQQEFEQVLVEHRKQGIQASGIRSDRAFVKVADGWHYQWQILPGPAKEQPCADS